ncbi:MAG: vitamin K epoxide reductase family protein [Pseudanabaenaceae cyanobacterium bins.68]|nr:vitamin K epoxide reductase family protein [Pseudanabaenaceae cyanobacterium bins.68]
MSAVTKPTIKPDQSQVILGILLLALVGFGLTSYLSISHVTNQAPAFCPEAGIGCDLVLHSSYAAVWGLPVSGFGALNYLAIALLAALGLVKPKLAGTARFLIFGLSTAASVFTGYLVWVILFVLSSSPSQPIFCVYCFSSAVLIGTIWSLNLVGNQQKSTDWANLIFTGFLVTVISLTATAGVYANQSQGQGLAGGLAFHLQQQGARMYGAYWCPHCQEQKAMFGKAIGQVPYVECDPRPQNAQPLLCQAKQIHSYPTWEIGGKLYEGVRSLPELAQISGFGG